MTRRLFLLLLLALAAPAAAQSPFDGWAPAQNLQVSAELVPQYTQVTGGQEFIVALNATVQDGWVFYSPHPGEDEGYKPKPARLEVSAGDWEVIETLWPLDHPHQTVLGEDAYLNHVYEGRFTVYARLRVPQGSTEAQEVTLTLRGQICGDSACVPISASDSATITIGNEAIRNPRFDGALQAGLGAAVRADQLVAARDESDPLTGLNVPEMTALAGLALALLAGLILNVMPCVLPVIPLKVLNLVQHAQQSHRHFRLLGLTFAAGVVLFFAGLAAFSAAVRLVTAETLAWGEHFQSEAFRIGMGLFLVAMAMNLFDIFTVLVPNKLAQMSQEQGPPRHGEYARALGSGVITAIMSTPCSFAYLATAFVWAQTRPLWLGSLAIVLIGVGMSLPYIMLVLFPQLVRRMPRPGRWMELFKHAMGFVLLGVAIWLLTTLPSENLPWVLGYAIVLSACLWMWGRWVGFGSSKAKLWTVRAIAAALAIAAGWWMLSGPTPLAVDFGPFDRQAISAAVDADRPVLIDFTADWCLNCKTVENTVYRDSRVGRLVRDKNVLAIKGDVTDAGSAAALMLEQELGEPGVPVSVLFVPGQPEPVRFHGVFSADALVAELEKLPDSPPTGAPPDDSQTESP